MAKTIDQLRAQATTIRDEQNIGRNTAQRVGGFGVDLVDKIETYEGTPLKLSRLDYVLNDFSFENSEIVSTTGTVKRYVHLAKGTYILENNGSAFSKFRVYDNEYSIIVFEVVKSKTQSSYQDMEFTIEKDIEAVSGSFDANSTFAISIHQKTDSIIKRLSKTEAEVVNLIESNDVVKKKIGEYEVNVALFEGYVRYDNGSINASTKNKYTDKIDLTDISSVRFIGTVYPISSTAKTGAAFYKGNNEFVKGIAYEHTNEDSIDTYKDYKVDVPADAEYMRITVFNDYEDIFYCYLLSNNSLEVVKANTEDLHILTQRVAKTETDIEKKGTLITPKDIDSFTKVRYHIVSSSAKWNSNTASLHINIPVIEGENILIKGNSINASQVAWLTNNDAPIAATDAPLVSGTSVIVIPAAGEILVTAPKTAKYLYVNINTTVSSTGTTIRTPESVNIIKTLEERLTNFGGSPYTQGEKITTTDSRVLCTKEQINGSCLFSIRSKCNNGVARIRVEAYKETYSALLFESSLGDSDVMTIKNFVLPPLFDEYTKMIATITLDKGAELEVDYSEIVSYQPKSTGIVSTSHLGMEHFAPSNTMAAYRMSIQTGYPIIVITMINSADGTFFCYHDNQAKLSLDGGKTLVALSGQEFQSKTDAELMQYTVHSSDSFNKYYKDERIPKFEDVVKLCAATGTDICWSMHPTPSAEMLAKVRHIIKKYNMEGHFAIKVAQGSIEGLKTACSILGDSLKYITYYIDQENSKNGFPDNQINYLMDEKFNNIKKYWGCYSDGETYPTKEDCDKVLAKGISLEIEGSYNNLDTIKRLVDLGCTTFFTRAVPNLIGCL